MKLHMYLRTGELRNLAVEHRVQIENVHRVSGDVSLILLLEDLADIALDGLGDVVDVPIGSIVITLNEERYETSYASDGS